MRNKVSYADTNTHTYANSDAGTNSNAHDIDIGVKHRHRRRCWSRGALAAAVGGILFARHHGAYTAIEYGTQFDMVLQKPLSLDPQRVGSATAMNSPPSVLHMHAPMPALLDRPSKQ